VRLSHRQHDTIMSEQQQAQAPDVIADNGLTGVPLSFVAEVPQGNVKKAMQGAGASSGDLWRVPVEDLHILDGLNVRGETPDYLDHIERIARSILSEGFYPDKALAVFVHEDGRIIVRDGHTRLRAARRAIELGAQIPVLPCVTAPKGSTLEDFTIGLVKSNSGRPLLPIEVAVVCKRLSGWGWTSAKIAERLDYTSRYVDELLDLLAAPAALVALVKDGTVSASTAMQTIKDNGATKAAEAIVKAAKEVKAKDPKGKVTAKVLKTTTDAKARPPRQRQTEAVAPTNVDPVKALRAVYDDPAFAKLADKVQSLVLAVVNP